ncbi:MAG: hypothetical protein AAGA03_06040 [Planctomycetota bacterium]
MTFASTSQQVARQTSPMAPGMSSNPPAPATKDYGYLFLLVAAALITCWLAATPLVPKVAKTTMERFHLRSASFAAFAAQAPIPPMYSFANQAAVVTSHQTPVTGEPDRLDATSGYLNHYPTRALTFAGDRFRRLGSGGNTRLTIQSTYRGQKLHTEYVVTEATPGRFLWERMEGQQ